MFFLRRCTGALPLVLALLGLTGQFLSAQNPEALLEAGEFAAAAEAFTARGDRQSHFEAAGAWLQLYDLAKAETAYLAVITDDAGALIVDSLTGLALHKAGAVNYMREDDAAAAAFYRRAIAVRDRVFTGPHNDRAKSRKNLAVSLRYLGRLDSAALLIREATAIYDRLPVPDTLNLYRGLNELASIALQQEDYQLANSSINAAMSLLGKSSLVSAADAFNGYYLGAEIGLHFKDYKEATDYATRAIYLAEKADDNEQLTDALIAQAGGYVGREQYLRAKAAYRRAADLLGEDEQAAATRVFIYTNLSSVAVSEGDGPVALDYALLANENLTENSLPAARREVVLVYGRALVLTGEAPAAVNLYNEALAAFSTNEPSVDELPRPDPDSISTSDLGEVSQLIVRRAQALDTMGRRAEALTDFETFFGILDRLRGRVNSDESRRFLTKDVREYFDLAVDLYLQSYAETGDEGVLWRAFELSERARAYTLLTALRSDRTSRSRKEGKLRGRIAELERAVANKPGQQPLLDAARLQLDRLTASEKTEEAVPETTLDREELLALLADRQTELLAYHLGPRQGYCFQLSADGGISVRKISTTHLTEQVTAWTRAIEESAYLGKSLRPAGEQRLLDADFLQRGLALRANLLPEEFPAERVCIIPDGALNFLPFSALPLGEAGAPLEYGRLDYFQRGREISYAYSARFLLELDKQPERTYAENLVAFAPEFRGNDDQAARRSIARGDLRALPGLRPLRHNQEEVRAIAGLVPDAKTFYGVAANRAAFLTTVGQGRVVHLSSHGTVNAADPNLSFIAFSQLGDSLELEELLYFNDLSTLPLPTELAVLSACETSLGEYVPGDVTLSLASAFAAAGARSTLTTLWPVDDAATKDLMVNFYERLTAGESRAAALAGAQTMHLKSGRYAHPYYWSAMTLYGAPGPVTFAESTWSSLWWFVLLGLIPLLWVLKFKRWYGSGKYKGNGNAIDVTRVRKK